MSLISKELSPEEMAKMTPQEFRGYIRRREWQPDEALTEYYCRGYTQHAVDIVPVDYALEFLIFCLRNPRACYVADVCDVGSPHPPLIAPDADVRTDCQGYRIFKNGEIVDEPDDVMKYWRDDMVAFLLNCSMGFEGVLRDKHVNWRTMGAYTSNIRCVPSGRFKNDNMSVSCRLFKTSLDAVRAIQITSQLSISHGYPVYIGDPAEIGVDIMKPDLWNPYPADNPPLPPQPNEICMTWGCGVTPQNAIKAAKPPLAITHYPGRMFVGDRRTEEFHPSFTT